jgi:membrane protein implicated in regulation of membrane protease activity
MFLVKLILGTAIMAFLLWLLPLLGIGVALVVRALLLWLAIWLIWTLRNRNGS